MQSVFVSFWRGERHKERREKWVCACTCGTAEPGCCLLTSLSCAGVTDTLIIQFNSGWQLLLALQLWLCQSFAPRPHLFLPWEQEQDTWPSSRQTMPPLFPGDSGVPAVGFHGLWVLALCSEHPEVQSSDREGSHRSETAQLCAADEFSLHNPVKAQCLPSHP